MIFKNTSLKFGFAGSKLFYTVNNLVGYKTFQVINLISKNVTNLVLNQLKNVVHSYSYNLSNCYGAWYPFRSQLFLSLIKYLLKTRSVFHKFQSFISGPEEGKVSLFQFPPLLIFQALPVCQISAF